MRFFMILCAAVLILRFAATQTTAFATSFTFTKVVDRNTQRPDSQYKFSVPTSPSTDGRYVVWVDGNYWIWSADLITNTLTKLAENGTPAPGCSDYLQSFLQGGNPYSPFHGGPYSDFNIIVRNGTVVFMGNAYCSGASAENGLYSVPATGGVIKRIVNPNSVLPNGGSLLVPIGAYGVSDSGVVAFTGANYSTWEFSVYTANIDGSNLSLIADRDHLFFNPTPNTYSAQRCARPFAGAVAIGGNSIIYMAGGIDGGLTSYMAIYAQAVGTTPLGTIDTLSCGNAGPVGPVVTSSLTPLPGDPTPVGDQLPQYSFVQTDGSSVYFVGSDYNDCCWFGIFSVPIVGGAVTKIVAIGDTLPVIGTVTDIIKRFSVDNGGVVFIAQSATQRGIFLYDGGQIQKVFASGDTLNGGILSFAGDLEVWPQCYHNGKIAFTWDRGVYVATVETAHTVTYNGNGNTGGSVPVDSTSYATGATVTVLNNTGNLVKTGYSFLGWNSAADNSGTSYAGGATFAIGSADFPLYALWTQSLFLAFDSSGTSGGTMTVPTLGLSCGSNCSSNQMHPGTPYTVTAAPNPYAFLYSLAGPNCTTASGNCTFTPTVNVTVTARFDFDKAHEAYISNGTTQGYQPTIQQAYSVATPGSTILSWAHDYPESLTCDSNKNVSLKGGYNQGYTTVSGMTSLIGSLTIERGILTVQGLVVK